MSVVTPGGGARPGAAGSLGPTHPALSPRSDPLPHEPPGAVRSARGGEGPLSIDLIDRGHSARALPIGVPPGALRPSFEPALLPTYRLQHQGLGGALAAREGAGKGSGRSGGGGGAATWCHSPRSGRARARAPGGGPGGGRSCGRRGRRSRRPSGWSERRAERGVGGRARAGGRAGEQLPHQHLRRLRLPEARRQIAGWIAWRTDAGARLGPGQLRRGSGLEARGFPAHWLPPGSGDRGVPGAGGAGAALAGRSPRGSARAAAPRPPAAAPSPTPRRPLRAPARPGSKLGLRGKCLHEPRGCPGSTTRVLKSVVASNISYLASMSYFG